MLTNPVTTRAIQFTLQSTESVSVGLYIYRVSECRPVNVHRVSVGLYTCIVSECRPIYIYRVSECRPIYMYSQ